MSDKERGAQEHQPPEYYFLESAAAFVRGISRREKSLSIPSRLLEPPLEDLSEADKGELIQIGQAVDLHLKKFKRAYSTMPRVRRSLGFLQSTAPESLLDIGSGRGNFLWPCLDAFPWLPVTTLEFTQHRFELHETVQLGGVKRLNPVFGDIQSIDPEAFGRQTFDVVTIFEVLEHIPDSNAAIRSALRLARRHLILSVPSKPDDNPEHIHLFNEEILTRLFNENGIDSIRFDYIPNHLFAFVTIPS